MAAIGGSSYEEMSKRMFIFVFTNEVASMYSWIGGKGKRKLNHLEVMKIMFSKSKYFLSYVIFWILKYQYMLKFPHEQTSYLFNVLAILIIKFLYLNTYN